MEGRDFKLNDASAQIMFPILSVFHLPFIFLKSTGFVFFLLKRWGQIVFFVVVKVVLAFNRQATLMKLVKSGAWK